jgi:arylsulfatase
MKQQRLLAPLLSALALLPLAATPAKAQIPVESPNIILILTDDQGYGDMSCHGQPFLKTPNIDKLYSQSTRFTNFHASPTCAPTRAALMTGLAPFKGGITHTILERERLALGITTLAEVLQSAGYETGIFGKWHLGDEDEYQPENRGFDEVFIHGAGGIGQTYPGSQGAVPGTGYFNPIIKHNGTFEQTEGYCTDVFFQQALGWIKHVNEENAHSATKHPFFAYIATNAPHAPFIVAESYKEPFRKFTEDEDAAAFFGMIVNIDENVGLLMEKLDEWGLADNTLLMFMTDNGTVKGSPYYNAGMQGAKGSLHEGGSRVPLFMRLPGQIPAGVDVTRMTRHYDLFPTLAEIAGADVPAGLDGRSLVPLIKDAPGDWQDPWQDRFTFFHLGRWGKKGAPAPWDEGNTDLDKAEFEKFAVRTEDWRLVGLNELYKINEDPGETANVITDNPEVAQAMLEAYERWWDSVRPLLVNEDASLDVPKPFVVQFEKQKAERGIPQWARPEL